MTDLTNSADGDDNLFERISAEFDGERAHTDSVSDNASAPNQDLLSTKFNEIGEAIRSEPPETAGKRTSHISAALEALDIAVEHSANPDESPTPSVVTPIGNRQQTSMVGRYKALPALAAAAAALILGGIVLSDNQQTFSDDAAVASLDSSNEATDEDLDSAQRLDDSSEQLAETADESAGLSGDADVAPEAATAETGQDTEMAPGQVDDTAVGSSESFGEEAPRAAELETTLAPGQNASSGRQGGLR